ncbi:glutamine-rich protein 2-like, partial [Oncorhynchus keta]|uniref:glutamine-rich protein 2-like n=1 Tax=Oncorhynchus keta TaxID=8018 RepID=UPI00227BE60A
VTEPGIIVVLLTLVLLCCYCAVTEPGVTEPGVTEPGVTEPGVTVVLLSLVLLVNEPGVTKPGVTEPGVNEPGVTEPGVNEPGVNEPGVTEPGVNEPGVTEPGVTEPSVNEPGVTEPGVNEPGVTEPGVTKPGVTEPAYTCMLVVFSRVRSGQHSVVHAGKGVGMLCICLPTSSVLSSSAFPQWISTINDSQLDSGDQLHWECKATGIPRPTYRWLRNGELITPQSRVEMVNGELIIQKVQQADSGMYQCVAENKYGAIYCRAELKIL